MANKNLNAAKPVRYRLTVTVHLRGAAAGADNLYIVGSKKTFGDWEPENALALKKLKNGSFRIIKTFGVGEVIEFKILSDKSWKNVEKGIYGEEVSNRLVYLTSNVHEPVVISKFANN